MINVQPIHPNDSWIVDESNRVVGVQTKNTAASFGNVTATTDSVTGGIGINGTIVDMAVTPDDTNTASYPVGTLFISPVV